MIGDLLKIKDDALKTGKEVLEDKKSVVGLMPDRFSELRTLDCFDLIKSRLVHGLSPGDAAKFIMDESGEFDKLTRITTESGMRDLLTEFRKTISATEMVEKVVPGVVKDAVERIRKGVDELNELEYLYMMQKDRIEIDYGSERKIRKLFKNTGNEIVIAMGILKLMSGLKQELGLLDKRLGTLEVDHTMRTELPYKSKAIEEVLRDPGSRAKVLGLAARMFSRPELMGTMFKDVSEVREAVETEVVVEEKEPVCVNK